MIRKLLIILSEFLKLVVELLNKSEDIGSSRGVSGILVNVVVSSYSGRLLLVFK